MKRILKIISLIFILISILCVNASANEAEDYKNIYNEVNSAAEELLNEAGINDVDFNELFNLSPRKVIDVFINVFKNSLSVPLKTAGITAALIIMQSVLNSLSGGKTEENISVSFALSAIIVSSLVIPLCEALVSAASAVKTVSDFMLIFIPVFTGVVSASGQPLSAFSYSGIMLFFGNVLEKLSSVIVLPTVSVLTVINVFSGLNKGVNAETLTKTVQKIITVFLSISSSLFVGLVSLKGSLAVSADSLAVKGIKLFSGSVIPIVGSALGDAVTSVLGSFSLIKSTLGVFGIIAVVLTVLPSVTELLAWYFSMSLCSLLSSSFGNNSVKSILDSLLSLISIVNVVTLLSGAVFILSTGVMLSLR